MVPLASLNFGCQRTTEKAEEVEEVSALRLFPPQGGQGTSMNVRFDASRSAFTYNDTSSVDFGDDITVLNLTIEDGWNANADIPIEPEAVLGEREVTVSTGRGTFLLEDAFEVVADSLIIEPSVGKNW